MKALDLVNEADSCRRLATNPLNLEIRRLEPVTDATSALLETASGLVGPAVGIFLGPHKEYQNAVRARSATEDSSANSAGAMALASVKNVGRFHSSLFKGTMVDMLLAVTEGLQAVPKLCGDQRIEHSPITDAKSGFVVTGRVTNLFASLLKAAHFIRPVFR